MERNVKSRPELRSNEEHSESRSGKKRDREYSKDARDKRQRRNRSRSRSRSSSSSEEDHRARSKVDMKKAPPPPIISKISMSIKPSASTGIQLKLNAPSKKPAVVPSKPSVASAFNADSDSEEEMPDHCKMKMRNIGKFTPTSSGPNSFGKTKIGFVDSKKIFEKKMQQMLKDMGDPV